MTKFRRFYPDVYPQMLSGNEVVDIVANDVDVAFRFYEGPLPDSSLQARRLGNMPMSVYAAPTYLERWGVPAHPSELATCPCIVTQFYFNKPTYAWPLQRGGALSDYSIRPVAVASDPEGLHGFLLAGEGLLMTNDVRVQADVNAGRLVRVLPDWSGPAPTLYAMRAGGRVQPPKSKLS